MQICVSKFTIIDSDNGLSPIRRQAIIWTNAGILIIRTLGTNFSEILIQIHTFSNKKMHLKMSSGKCQPFCLGLSVSRCCYNYIMCELAWVRFCPWNMPGFRLSIWGAVVLPSHDCKITRQGILQGDLLAPCLRSTTSGWLWWHHGWMLVK